MQEVRGAVERIDHPHVLGVDLVLAAFLREVAVRGIGLAQHREDRILRGMIDLGDEVVLALGADVELVDVERGAGDEAAGLARGLDGRVEHGVHGDFAWSGPRKRRVGRM